MAHGVKWNGANGALGPPEGTSEDQCRTLPVFNNGACSVSCWELDDDEIREIVRTRRIFLSVWFGPTQPPVFIGSERTVHAVVADFGGVWKLGDLK